MNKEVEMLLPKKRANTSGVGKIIIYCEDIYNIDTSLQQHPLTTPIPDNHTYSIGVVDMSTCQLSRIARETHAFGHQLTLTRRKSHALPRVLSLSSDNYFLSGRYIV